MPIILLLFYLASIVLRNVHGVLEHEIPRRSILSRRAIDGTRGRKYFDPEEEGSFDSYGSAGGQYDRYKNKQDHNDIRMNVPGEPGIDYPAYTTLPQTGFSCERRSRGYYADEVAGCQVFHVCHDILVSSFLCPIGSIFSQKLLTCDWWSKVDCSLTRKFIEINNDDYNQEDDDELIRKAYGMMGLQTGMDITSDELVDPDRGGKIIDHSVAIESTANDLPSHRHVHLLSAYDEQSERRRTSTSTSYKNSFRGKSHHARPQSYQDSPIVHIRRIGEEDYREATKYPHLKDSAREKLGKMISEFQPSYAPTVPTVTTTTRRFYSPTIPTTYRPSTLAYNIFDQTIASSDHLYSHSKRARDFVVTPTYPDDESESRVSTKRNYNDSDAHDYDRTERIEPRNDRLKSSFDLSNGNPFSNVDFDARNSTDVVDISVAEGYSDGVETTTNIGLARAFNGSNKFMIYVQYPADVTRAKDDNNKHGSSFLLSSRGDRYVTDTTNVFNLTKSLIENGERSTNLREMETTMALNYDTTPVHAFGNIFEESTTPLIEYSSDVEDHRSGIEELSTTTLSYEENSRSGKILRETIEENPTLTTKVSKPFNGSSHSTQESRIFTNVPYDSVVRTDIYSAVLQPDIILKPPTANPSTEFRINVPNYPSTTRVYLSERRSALDLPPPLKESKNLSIEENAQSFISEMLIGLSKDMDHVDSTQRSTERYEKRKFVVLSNDSTLGEDQNQDFPYRDSPGSSKDDSSTITPFISQQEKEKKNYATEKLHQIEIVKSVEGVTNYETTLDSLLPSHFFTAANETVRNTKSLFAIKQEETTDFSVSSGENKSESDVSSSGNANALSLVQPMAKLFKIDHIPRPFALNGLQSVMSRSSAEYEYWGKKEIRKIAESTSVPLATDKEILPTARDSLDGTITPRNALKDQKIELDEHEPSTEEINRPLYDTEKRQLIYQFPHIQRSFNFKKSKELGGPSRSLTISTSTAKSFTSLPTTTTTESVKAIVETEFVPSIGFSFDTNEGRQKYINAILDGLLYEPIYRKSGINDSADVEIIESSSTIRPSI